MTLTVVTHSSGHDHHPPDGHPDRLLNARSASRADLVRVHDPRLVEAIFAASPAVGDVSIDADTWMSSGSLNAALHASGAAIDATRQVLEDGSGVAFAACRP